MNLSEFLEFEARDLEAEFAGLTAGDATPRAIRRRRTVRAGATAGVAAVGLGAVALGGLRLAGLDLPEPGGSDVVAPSPDAVQALLIDPDDDPAYSPWATVPACGAPAPQVRTESDGLRLHIRSAHEITATATGVVTGSDVRASLTNIGAKSLVANVSPVAVVWVRDGVVAAYSASPYNSVPWYGMGVRVSGQEVTFNVSGRVEAETYRCDSPPDGPWHTLEAGDYLAYPVVRVVGSVDSADGMARVPVDATLVAEPLTVTLTSSWQQARASLDDVLRRSLPVEPQCGDPFDGVIQYSEELWLYTYPIDEHGGEQPYPELGGTMAIVAGSGRLVSPTTITLPETFDVWYISAERYGAGFEHEGPVISGHAVVRVEGPRVIQLTRNGAIGGQFEGRVIEQEICASAPGAFARSTADVVVTWTDIEGTREVSNIPG